MVVVEYIGLFILLAVIVFASMPGVFYEWFSNRFFEKRNPKYEKNKKSDQE